MVSRRTLLQRSSVALAAFAIPLRGAAKSVTEAASKALRTSDVIYITPLRHGGAESTCHAEVWFTFDSGEVYVVTDASAWRARSVGLGMNQARMWVGEFGEWKGAKEAYRKAPQLSATASLVEDTAVHVRVLESFGKKYHMEWLVWGPRFKNGLADGSRVMLRYTPTV